VGKQGVAVMLYFYGPLAIILAVRLGPDARFLLQRVEHAIFRVGVGDIVFVKNLLQYIGTFVNTHYTRLAINYFILY